MFGVDYPHFETAWPATMQRVSQLLEPGTISEEDARRILFDNAAEVYGFDRNALKPWPVATSITRASTCVDSP